MINIISTQVGRTKITGPKKVLDNTCKGLDEIGIKYVFNQPINNYKYNWIHDDAKSIIEAGFINKPVLIGPNTVVLPKDLPVFRRLLHPDSIYLCPSQWVIDMWIQSGFKECKMVVWPAGVDLDSFMLQKISASSPDKILIYFKQRDPSVLQHVIKIINNKDIDYDVIHYGFYEEQQYKKSLSESNLCVWVGCSESQGIALQEALATGIPIIVLDATNLFDAVSENKKGYFDYKVPSGLSNIVTTSAPYFDERCGLKIYDIDRLDASIDYMLSNIKEFSPRDYIRETLSLDAASNNLIDIFNDLNVNQKAKSFGYVTVSKVLYYLDLFGKGWFYRWLLFKLRNIR